MRASEPQSPEARSCETPGTEPTRPIRVQRDAAGAWLYHVALPPEAMPPVRKRDLELAWDSAHAAARAGQWGDVRAFRFLRADGSHAEMLLAEPNAACWAAAVDRMLGLDNPTGLSLCLRLLALVDLMARARWLDGLHRMRHGVAELDIALLRLAAAARLTPDGGFDPEHFRARLFPLALARPTAAVHSRLAPASRSPARAKAARPSTTRAPALTGATE